MTMMRSSKAMDMVSSLSSELQLLLSMLRQRPAWTATNGEVVLQDDILVTDLVDLRQKMFAWAAATSRPSAESTSISDSNPNAPLSTAPQQQITGPLDAAAATPRPADPWVAVDPCEFLTPFLSIIRSPRTDTAATTVALRAVRRILENGLLMPEAVNADRAMHLVVESVTMCRFEVGDTGTEEAVLTEILEVLLATLASPPGRLLSDRAACSVVNTCFRVVHQSVVRSELLQAAASRTMQAAVQALFQRLQELPVVPAEEEAEDGEGEEEAGGRGTEGTLVVPESEDEEGRVRRETKWKAKEGEEKEGAEGEEEESIPLLALGGSLQGDMDAQVRRLSAPESLQALGGTKRERREGAVEEEGAREGESGKEGGAAREAGSGEEGDSGQEGSSGDRAAPEQEGRAAKQGAEQEDAEGGEEDEDEGEEGEGEEEEDEEEGAAVLWRKALAMSVGRPFGPACLIEVLHFLCSLLTLEEHHFGALACGLSGQEEDLPMFALQLITTALQAAGPHVANHPRLLALVADDLFRSLFALGASPNPHVFPLICSLALFLFVTLRPHLKLQLEAFFVIILGKAARGRHGYSSAHQQESLESLLDFFSLPEFAIEIFGNYDCDIARSNLLEDLAGILSKAAFPLHAQLGPSHVLALRSLLQTLRFMAGRVEQGPPPRPPGPISSVRQLEGPEFWTCQWGTMGGAGSGAGAEGPGGEAGAVGEGAEEAGEEWVQFVRGRKLVKRKLMQGAELFNHDKSKGLRFLQACQLLPTPLDAGDVAAFLRFVPGLSKQVVGEYLGGHDDFNIKALYSFVELFDFEGMTLDGALRAFLDAFRLPGEAQKISRILEAFAARYYRQCPQLLASQDAAYVLSYSVIMLNTDQHNGQVRRKMTEEEFIRNNRKINDGKDLPREMLSALFHSIAKDEIRVSSDPLPPASPRSSARSSGSRTLPSSGSSSSSAIPAALRTPRGPELYGWGPAAEMTSSRWVEIVKRGPQSLPYVCCPDSRPLLDHDVFASLAGPTLAAMAVVFEHSEDRAVLQMCLRGFEDASRVCAAHCMRDVLDDLVVALCRFTTLLRPGLSAMPRSSSGGTTPRGLSPAISGRAGPAAGSGVAAADLPGGPYSEDEAAALIFADDQKALPAALLVFATAAQYGDFLRTAWRDVVDCVLALHRLSLLPLQVLVEAHECAGHDPALLPRHLLQQPAQEEGEGDGGEDPAAEGEGERKPAKLVLPVSTRMVLRKEEGRRGRGRAKKSAGFMSRLSQLFLFDADEEEEPSPQLVAAQRRVLSALQQSRIEALFADSKFLQADSLLHLTKALIWAAGSGQLKKFTAGQVGGKEAVEAEDEDTDVFCLDLLLAVTLANRDRILLLWPAVADHLAGVVEAASSPSLLVERAVFGLLRVCRRLVPYKEDVADELLRSLHIILRLDARLADVLCERITRELLLLLQANAGAAAAASGSRGHIRSRAAWRTVCSLLAVAARHPEAVTVGFEALKIAVAEAGGSAEGKQGRSPAGSSSEAVSPSLAPSLETAMEYAESRAGGPERSLQAVGMLASLVAPLQRQAQQLLREGGGAVAEEEASAAEGGDTGEEGGEGAEGKEDEARGGLRAVWALWRRLTLFLASAGTDSREAVRNAALQAAGHCVAAAPAIAVPASHRLTVLRDGVLPAIDRLLEVGVRDKPSNDFPAVHVSLDLATHLLAAAFQSLLPRPAQDMGGALSLHAPPPAACFPKASLPAVAPLWLAALLRLQRCALAALRGGGEERVRVAAATAVRTMLRSSVVTRFLDPPTLALGEGLAGGGSWDGSLEGVTVKDVTKSDGAIDEHKLWLTTWKAADIVYPGVTLDGVMAKEMGEIVLRREKQVEEEVVKEGQAKAESDYVIVTKDEPST